MGGARYSSVEEGDFIYAVTAILVPANGMFQSTVGLSMPFRGQCDRLGSRSMNHLD